MQIPKSSHSSKSLLCVFGAVMFALFSIAASRLTSFSTRTSGILFHIDLTWVFWVMITCAVALLVPSIILILRSLHEKGSLPKVFAVFFQDPLQNWFAHIVVNVKSRLTSFRGHLAVVSAAILLVIAVLSNTYLVRDREMGTYLNELVSGVLGTSRPPSITPSVLQIGLSTSSSNATDYLRHCITIVKELETAGAKAVLVDVRGIGYIKDRPEYELIQELAKSSIVVLGVDNYWELHETSFSRGIYTFRPYESYLSPVLNRIQPGGDALRYPGTPMDVSMELLRKYRDYALTLMPKRDGSTLVFGDYRIPITRDGSMYSRALDNRYGRTGIIAHVGLRSDTLTYFYGGGTFASLDGLGDRIREKVFFILWHGHASVTTRMEDDFTARANASSLENILCGNFIRKMELSPLWLALFCIGISALIAYNLRPLVSVLTIFVFGITLLVIDSLLYSRMGILVEIVYPLLSILMSMAILPALSFVHRLRES